MSTQRPGTADFTPIAARYDSSRDIPEPILNACYRRLIEQGLLPARGTILDAGCGTGQISLPLAAMGYAVHGLDISPAMAAIAQGKCQPGWNAVYGAGDARALDLPDAAFDTVVVSKLFMHIADWRQACAELARVLKPGGHLLHIADRGSFGNAARKFMSARADALGFTGRFLGSNDRTEIAACLAELGLAAVAFDASDLRWNKSVRLGDVLDELRQRLFAEFWYLPETVHAQLVDETARWIDNRPRGRDAVEQMKPFLAVEVFRKS